MAQYNSVFSNQVNQTPSLTGEETIRVDQIDFDTTCPCQITACDGGTIKVCAKMEIEDLVLDSLCIDGELGCDSLVLQTGITEGIKFTDDPCATPATARRLAMYEDGASVTLLSQSGRNLNLETGPDDINITSGRDIELTSTVGEINIVSNGAAPTATGPANILIKGQVIRFQNGYGAGTSKRQTPYRPAPTSSAGAPGDFGGEWSADINYWYFCYHSYGAAGPPGTNIWSRTPVGTNGTW